MKVFKKDYFFFAFTTILAVFLSLLPLIYNLFTPVSAHKFNPLWHNWPYDFSYYLSIIKQGAQGSLQVISKYTTEPQNSVFLRFSYVLLGFLGGRILKTDPTLIYHLYRIVFAFLKISVCFLFLQYFFKDKTLRKLSFLLFLFAGPFYSLNLGQPLTKLFQNVLPWVTFVQTFRRNSFLPHYLFGNFSLVLSLLLFFLSVDKKNLKIAFLGGLVIGLAGLDHPPSLIFSLILIALYILFNIFLKIEKNQKKLFLNFLVLLIPSLLFCFYILYASSLFPWNLQTKTKYPIGSLFETLLLLGPTSFLSLLSILFFKRIKKSRILTLCFLWLVLSLFLTFVVFPLGLFAQSRFLPVVLPLPMAVLSIFFLKNLKLHPKILLAFVFLIIIGTLPGSLKDYYEQFRLIKSLSRQSLEAPPITPYIDYPSKDILKAILFLEKNTRPNQIVLSHFFAGNLIPAYSGNPVYFGHSVETFKFQSKKNQIEQFFSGKMNPLGAQEFLIKNKIDFIFYGPQEENLNLKFDILTYKFLEKIFQNPQVLITKVIK